MNHESQSQPTDGPRSVVEVVVVLVVELLKL